MATIAIDSATFTILISTLKSTYSARLHSSSYDPDDPNIVCWAGPGLGPGYSGLGSGRPGLRPAVQVVQALAVQALIQTVPAHLSCFVCQ